MDPDGRLRPLLEPMRRRTPRLHGFLTTDKRGPRIAREILSVVLIVAALLLGIWIYTGQPLNDAPVVVVESGSMMHCGEGRGPEGDACTATSWGRIGTIDPGDVIFVRDVDGPEDVRTYAEGGQERYGHPGDVVVYRPGGNAANTPVIHRALFWIHVHPDGTLSIIGTDIQRVERLTDAQAASLGVPPGADARSGQAAIDDIREKCADANMTREAAADPFVGLVTAGDNNGQTDLVGDPIAGTKCPLPATWLVGKARGEIPWLGMLKLRFTDAENYGKAPGDVKTLMWLSVGVILFGPFLVDVGAQMVRRRIHEARARRAEDAARSPAREGTAPPGPGTGEHGPPGEEDGAHGGGGGTPAREVDDGPGQDDDARHG